LLVAEKWHVPPWVVENDATQEWWDRYAAYSEELATFEKKRRKKKGDNLTTKTD